MLRAEDASREQVSLAAAEDKDGPGALPLGKGEPIEGAGDLDERLGRAPRVALELVDAI